MPSQPDPQSPSSGPLDERDIENVKSLIIDSNLVAIDYHEISAERLSPDSVQEGDEGNFSVEVQTRSDEGSFGVRLYGTLTFPGGKAVAGVAGEYELLNDAKPEDRTIRAFANEVGVMTVYPYLREAISTITGRVFGDPVNLPLVGRGDISVALSDED